MKKISCIILSLLVLVFIFAGCSQKTETQNSDKIKYTYDSAYSYDGSTISAYESLCDAVVTYKNEVRFNTGMLSDVLQLFYTSFPLNALVETLDYSDGNSGIKIIFKNDEKTHKELVSQFQDKISEIIRKCNTDSSKYVFVINAYNYVSSNISLSEEDGLTVYDAIVSGKGNEYTYSNMFEYILQQGGIPAYHILATDESGASRGLSQADVNGALYFFDVGQEFKDNKGEKLLYFGMTTEELTACNVSNPLYTSTDKAKEADNPYFDACRLCKSWEIDSSKKKLLVTRNDGVIVEIAL